MGHSVRCDVCRRVPDQREEAEVNEERERLALLSGEDTCRSKCGFLNRAPEAWECRTCGHEKCWHDMRRNEQIAYRAKERSRLKNKGNPKPENAMRTIEQIAQIQEEMLGYLRDGMTYRQAAVAAGANELYCKSRMYTNEVFNRQAQAARSIGELKNKEARRQERKAE